MTVLITGAASGMGYEVGMALLKKDTMLFLQHIGRKKQSVFKKNVRDFIK